MKKDLEKTIENVKKEEMNVKEEFEKVAGEYVKKNDFDYTMKIIVNNENEQPLRGLFFSGPHVGYLWA